VDPYPQATLSDPELDRAAVMDLFPQAIHSESGLEQTAVVDPYPQATLSDAEPYRAAVMEPYPQAIHSAVMDPCPQAMHSDPELDRSAATSAMETHVESPDLWKSLMRDATHSTSAPVH